METRVLSNFLRVAETGNLSRAAAALNLAQPALSRQIAILEQDVGAQLLVRHRRGVALTEAGQLFRDHAQAIVAAVEAARAEVSSTGSTPGGTVTLGLPTSMIYVLSGDMVEAYRASYPNVFLRIHEAVGHVIEALLKDGRLDAAILLEPRPLPGIALTPLLREDLYVVGGPDAKLSLDTPVAPSDLASLPMIMLAPENHVRVMVEGALGGTGKVLDPALEVEGQPLAFELVRRGLGYTVLPRCAVQAEMSAGRMRGAPIAGMTLEWSLGVVRARADAPAVRALTGLLRDLAAARIADGAWQPAG